MSPMRAKDIRAIVTVGEGRGFIVEGDERRFVVTAAHCLPRLPPCESAASHEDRTFKLLGRLGDEPSVWAQCLFANPVADIAVLGSPDDQACSREAKDYGDFVDGTKPLPVTKTAVEGSALLLSLSNHWFKCSIITDGRSLWISYAVKETVGGMSGSPIVTEEGAAIGVVCTSDQSRGGGPNPSLFNDLPVWLYRELGLAT